MNKKNKLITICVIAILMVIWWAGVYFSHTVAKQINYYWQVGMGLSALIFAVFGIFTAGKWGWLKSGVGRGVFFISLALFMWGVGQMGWCYYLFAEPNVQSPPSHILDAIDLSAIPLWFIGVLMLAKPTGARYGLKNVKGIITVGIITVVMSIVSAYLLVFVARGGLSYFHMTSFWNQVADLGYSIGDAIIATICISYYALSWKILGGRFKIPILVILIAFIFLYFADFLYSYLAGKNTYYNGDVADLLYMITITIFGLGVNLLDPSSFHNLKPAPLQPATENGPQVAQAAPNNFPTSPPADTHTSETPPDNPPNQTDTM